MGRDLTSTSSESSTMVAPTRPAENPRYPLVARSKIPDNLPSLVLKGLGPSPSQSFHEKSTNKLHSLHELGNSSSRMNLSTRASRRDLSKSPASTSIRDLHGKSKGGINNIDVDKSNKYGKGVGKLAGISVKPLYRSHSQKAPQGSDFTLEVGGSGFEITGGRYRSVSDKPLRPSKRDGWADIEENTECGENSGGGVQIYIKPLRESDDNIVVVTHSDDSPRLTNTSESPTPSLLQPLRLSNSQRRPSTTLLELQPHTSHSRRASIHTGNPTSNRNSIISNPFLNPHETEFLDFANLEAVEEYFTKNGQSKLTKKIKTLKGGWKDKWNTAIREPASRKPVRRKPMVEISTDDDNGDSSSGYDTWIWNGKLLEEKIIEMSQKIVSVGFNDQNQQGLLGVVGNSMANTGTFATARRFSTVMDPRLMKMAAGGGVGSHVAQLLAEGGNCGAGNANGHDGQGEGSDVEGVGEGGGRIVNFDDDSPKKAILSEEIIRNRERRREHGKCPFFSDPDLTSYIEPALYTPCNDLFQFPTEQQSRMKSLVHNLHPTLIPKHPDLRRVLNWAPSGSPQTEKNNVVGLDPDSRIQFSKPLTASNISLRSTAARTERPVNFSACEEQKTPTLAQIRATLLPIIPTPTETCKNPLASLGKLPPFLPKMTDAKQRLDFALFKLYTRLRRSKKLQKKVEALKVLEGVHADVAGRRGLKEVLRIREMEGRDVGVADWVVERFGDEVGGWVGMGKVQKKMYVGEEKGLDKNVGEDEGVTANNECDRLQGLDGLEKAALEELVSDLEAFESKLSLEPEGDNQHEEDSPLLEEPHGNSLGPDASDLAQDTQDIDADRTFDFQYQNDETFDPKQSSRTEAQQELEELKESTSNFPHHETPKTDEVALNSKRKSFRPMIKKDKTTSEDRPEEEEVQQQISIAKALVPEGLAESVEDERSESLVSIDLTKDNSNSENERSDSVTSIDRTEIPSKEVRSKSVFVSTKSRQSSIIEKQNATKRSKSVSTSTPTKKETKSRKPSQSKAPISVSHGKVSKQMESTTVKASGTRPTTRSSQQMESTTRGPGAIATSRPSTRASKSNNTRPSTQSTLTKRSNENVSREGGNMPYDPHRSTHASQDLKSSTKGSRTFLGGEAEEGLLGDVSSWMDDEDGLGKRDSRKSFTAEVGGEERSSEAREPFTVSNQQEVDGGGIR
ncbi:hypothetical protein HDV05_007250 [Chytridiales sp. JEL 0842]|nr:hypothetical protein HDV05_007250 [Chytridiales sp. JEL 0842]